MAFVIVIVVVQVRMRRPIARAADRAGAVRPQYWNNRVVARGGKSSGRTVCTGARTASQHAPPRVAGCDRRSQCTWCRVSVSSRVARIGAARRHSAGNTSRRRDNDTRALTDMTGAYFSVPTLCAIALVHVYWALGGRRGKGGGHSGAGRRAAIAADRRRHARGRGGVAGRRVRGCRACRLAGTEHVSRHDLVRGRCVRTDLRGAGRRRFPIRRLLQADSRVAFRAHGHAVLLAALRGAGAVHRVDVLAVVSAHLSAPSCPSLQGIPPARCRSAIRRFCCCAVS